jgi:cyanate lyase
LGSRLGLTFLQFGDGIMSMIDCRVNIAKKEDPKGDRVILTFE